MADEETLNPRLPKTILETLGPHWTELIDITDKVIEELEKTLQEDTRVANDENEEPSVRERARERVTENTERRDELVQERERIVEKLPLRERIIEVFKKYGWTLKVLFLAASVTLGAYALYLITTIKNGANTVSNGLKKIGKKVGSLLPVSSDQSSASSLERPDRLSPFLVKTLGC